MLLLVENLGLEEFRGAPSPGFVTWRSETPSLPGAGSPTARHSAVSWARCDEGTGENGETLENLRLTLCQ